MAFKLEHKRLRAKAAILGLIDDQELAIPDVHFCNVSPSRFWVEFETTLADFEKLGEAMVTIGLELDLRKHHRGEVNIYFRAVVETKDWYPIEATSLTPAALP